MRHSIPEYYTMLYYTYILVRILILILILILIQILMLILILILTYFQLRALPPPMVPCGLASAIFRGVRVAPQLPANKNWVAVQEPILSYQNAETILFTIYPYTLWQFKLRSLAATQKKAAAAAYTSGSYTNQVFGIPPLSWALESRM